MIDIIGHFFVLYPLLTFVKDTTFFGPRSNLKKFGISLVLLVVAALLTNMYLMDSSLVQRGPKDQNLYELMELTPGDLNSTNLRKKYLKLSK